MIVEEKLDGWNNNLIKTDEVIYPQSKDDKAPKNYFLGIFLWFSWKWKKFFIY